MKRPNERAWDGHRRRSSAALIAAFLLNGVVTWPAALFLGASFVIGYTTSTVVAISLLLFLSGLTTMAFVSLRKKSFSGNALKWIAIGFNGVLVLWRVLNWARSFAGTGDLLTGDAAIVAIGLANLVCIALIRHYHSGTLCPCCGYNLIHLRSKGCPECGWERPRASASATRNIPAR